MISLTVAFSLLAWANTQSLDRDFILPLALIGIGWAFGVPPLSSAVIKISPRNQTSVATGILYTVAYIGWAASVAITGYILVALGKHYFSNYLLHANITLNANQHILANRIYSGALSAKSIISQKNNVLTSAVIGFAREAFMNAFAVVMWLTAAIHLFGLLVSFFIKKTSIINSQKQESLS